MSSGYSSAEILRKLRQAGFVEISQRGSHIKLRRRSDAGGEAQPAPAGKHVVSTSTDVTITGTDSCGTSSPAAISDAT